MIEWPIIIATAVITVVFIIIFTGGYVKAPPDIAYIISGLRRRTIIGKAAVKIPFLERLDRLSLKLISVDVKTSSAVPTADYINIIVDAAVNVKISSDPEKLALAAENFLNQSSDYVRSIAKEVLEGNMREIVGQMRLVEMVGERQQFAELVKRNAEPDLAAMGLDIVSFNVQNFVDSNGVIEDLGIDNISQIKKKAAIAKAEANKEIAVAQADADRQSSEARVNANREIAKKENQLAIERAELKKNEDTVMAEADAAYQIQEQTQRKTIEIATAEVSIAKQEKEIEIKQREAAVQEQTLNASVRKQADADLYRRQKQAEADKYERERVAEAELAAKHKEAEGIRLMGEAEADAIRQKGLAEAEAMERKAEAYQKYGKAAIAEMVVAILPQVAEMIARPLSQIDRISIIGSDSSGVGSVASNVPAVMAKAFESVKETTGIDLGDIMMAESYGAKVNRNLNVSGLDTAAGLNNAPVDGAGAE
jgi:flotillin